MSTYRIANISLGKASLDHAYSFRYEGHDFEVQRFGAHFSIAYMKELMRTLRNQVDAFAISDIPPTMRIGGKSYVHRQVLDLMSTPTSIPLCDGYRIREIATVSSISEMIEDGSLDPKKGIFFPIGLMNLELIQFLSAKYAHDIHLGDALSVLGIPKLLSPSDDLTRVAQFLMNFVNMRDIEKQMLIASNPWKKFARERIAASLGGIQTVFSDIGVIALYGKDTGFIRGKDLLLTSSNPTYEKELSEYKPNSIRSVFPTSFQFSPYINYSVLDATLRLAFNKTAPLSIEEWQPMISKSAKVHTDAKRYILTARPSLQTKVSDITQKIAHRVRGTKAPDFAFIVHALSKDDLFHAPGLKPLRNLPDKWTAPLEKFAAKTPGFTYGHISGIISQKNNREVSGIIYALLSTPKMMKEEDPQITYRKIERLCNHAAESGAKVIGLGAYTKIVGDSGASINRNSPIPVTTGNSLSASATLWAVHDAVKQMGILTRNPESGLTNGTAMVIGASGSIGKVSAKLLSLVFTRLILVAPRLNRLEELEKEIREISPNCEIVLSTDANPFAPESDVLVTATSAFDQKIVDVELLKPGCIVCDCSRPLDFSVEDAIKRPDVLIIESGEVVLPGPMKLTCNLGLPDNSVYACLGETAILAMEGLHTPFTLGRDIDWTKVRQIYRLAREHGVKLAAIRGHAGFVSRKEIEIVKSLALKRLPKY